MPSEVLSSTVMVGALLGPAEAALYAVARQIGDGVLRPNQFLTPSIYPELARLLAACQPDRARARALRSTAATAGGAGALLAALALLGEPCCGWSALRRRPRPTVSRCCSAPRRRSASRASPSSPC